ncbi:hypothetical protein CVT24_008258 [Panaeolus cyanescens]|uniref:Uncharacterized protein n=1 Tax=Panaeolus cyanescens TaxID=181874 RepID=A0A409VF85_9AGAR|nr:hypothetical protein CVT24_008258 [Panaeolus cyanescens]
MTDEQRVSLYDARWKVLRSQDNIAPLTFDQMPWPVLSAVTSLKGLNGKQFALFYEAAAKGRSHARVIKEALLRFHPDKFANLEPKIHPDALADVRSGMELVIHYLNDIKNL